MFSIINRTPISNGIQNLIKIQRAFRTKGIPMAPQGWYSYNEHVAVLRDTTDRRKNSCLSMVFKYKHRMPPMEKTYGFFQTPDESVNVALERIQKKIGNEVKIRIKLGMTYGATEEEAKAIANGDVPECDVSLLTESGEKITDVTFNEFLATNPDATLKAKLKIYEQEYDVVYKVPFVIFMDLPSTIMAGEDCYPTNMNVENTTKDECEYEWFRGLMGEDEDATKIEWQSCGKGFSYKVSKEDVGFRLRVWNSFNVKQINSTNDCISLTPCALILQVVCTPKRGDIVGPSLAYRSPNAIVEQIGGEYDAFAERHTYTTTQLPDTGDRFRVVSYNILADFYNDSKSSLSEWYPYCQQAALEIDYRKKLFIRELRGYHSDIICLQEVDSKVFKNDLQMMMETDGMHGSLKRKGAMPEGMVTFYNTKKFR